MDWGELYVRGYASWDEVCGGGCEKSESEKCEGWDGVCGGVCRMSEQERCED